MIAGRSAQCEIFGFCSPLEPDPFFFSETMMVSSLLSQDFVSSFTIFIDATAIKIKGEVFCNIQGIVGCTKDFPVGFLPK